MEAQIGFFYEVELRINSGDTSQNVYTCLVLF